MHASTEEHSLGRILLVDDETAILRTFRYCLEDQGYQVSTATSAAQADALLLRQVFDLCFLDLRLGADDGLDVLTQMRLQAPWMRVVIITAHSAVDTAVDAIQAGAADYLVKPCSPEQLRLAAAKQLEARQLVERLERLEGYVRKPGDGLDSQSPTLMAVLQTAKQVADTDANILILGESGTGKGELAQAIHRWSKRAKKSCITINCPSLSAELMESELFGHNRGAFTGASESTLGRVNQADGGSLFLDEIGELPLAAQAKLLRVLQSGQLQRVGADQEQRVNVRVLAASNRDLAEEVRAGRFRADLYHRLSVYPLKVPALRERGRDVLLLAGYFLEENRARLGLRSLRLTNAAQASLQAYQWPGNVRELEHLIGRAALKALASCNERPRILSIDSPHLDLPEQQPTEPQPAANNPATQANSLPLREAVDAYQKQLISQTLERHQHKWASAARELGIDRANLIRLAKRLGLQ